MKYLDLIKSEDVSGLVRVALKRYLAELNVQTNQSVEFILYKYRGYYKRKDMSGKYYLDEYKDSGIIVHKVKGLLLDLRQCFSDLVNGYVTILLPDYYANDLIVPGNNRIRVFRSSGCLVLLKPGLPPSLIKNELKYFDEKIDYRPKILSVYSFGFEEQIVKGIPLNRSVYSKEELYNLCVRHFQIFNMKNWKVLEGNKISSYILTKYDNLNILIDDFKVNLLRNCEKNCSVTVGQGHGDFQLGNLLRSRKGNIILIDWEYCDRYHVLYDFYVLEFGLRSNQGFMSSHNSFKALVKEKFEYDLNDADWLILELEQELFLKRQRYV